MSATSRPELLRVDPAAPDPAVIERAAAVLRAGGLVAFPTETVYGLGANALDADAVRAIFAAKGRPGYNPLIVHVPDVGSAQRLVTAWPEPAARAAVAFWPGPLTLVLPRAAQVPDIVSAGLPTVGVRVPAHPVALALLRAAAVPVAAPSANPSTRVSATRAEHVIRGLAGLVDIVLDGGATPAGIESTVLDVTRSPPVLLRPGAVGRDEIEAVLGAIVLASYDAGEAARPAPGMLDRHYSPAARLVVFDSAEDAAIRAAGARAEGRYVGAIVRHSFPGTADELLVLPDEPAGYARLLYASLYALDDAGCDLVLVEAVPATEAWRAVADRLRRAAG